MTFFLIITSIVGWIACFALFWLTAMISKLYMVQKEQTHIIAEHAEFLSRYIDWDKVPPPHAE